ncbi:hypothetical protein ROHU_021885 [Labeo rohita]|uniref:Uncharacterized protein n=1 Tax=Labeo rohita TaxID=84645 RepID=A0A498MZJ5_LABRO|nr:hypothetical protein ROHU_021885 [Labeo rohita]
MQPEEPRKVEGEPKREASEWGEHWARPRLVEGLLLLRPDVRGEPGLVRDDGGVEQGKFGALLDLFTALAAGVDLGAGLADSQGTSGWQLKMARYRGSSLVIFLDSDHCLRSRTSRPEGLCNGHSPSQPPLHRPGGEEFHCDALQCKVNAQKGTNPLQHIYLAKVHLWIAPCDTELEYALMPRAVPPLNEALSSGAMIYRYCDDHLPSKSETTLDGTRVNVQVEIFEPFRMISNRECVHYFFAIRGELVQSQIRSG